MWEKQSDIILQLGTRTFFTSVIPQMSIFNAHLRVASNLSLKFIILTKRKCLIVLKSLSLEVSTTCLFKEVSTSYLSLARPNSNSDWAWAFSLLCLPEEPATTLLLPSRVPGAIWSLDPCLLITCFHVWIFRRTLKTQYAPELICCRYFAQWNGVRFPYYTRRLWDPLKYRENSLVAPFKRQALQHFQWLPWPQAEES